MKDISEMYPSNHKTVFVLDHTPYFGVSCEAPLEFDVNKSRGTALIPLAPITKSLWTCSVEAAVEYCRIVWDLFPEGKLIRFIVANQTPHSLNTWAQAQQHITQILTSLAQVGTPPKNHPSTEYSLLSGLHSAIETLTQCSELQHQKRTNLSENASKILNRCRVICITSVRSNNNIQSMEDYFSDVLTQQNNIASGSDQMIPVDHCHLVIINIYPNSQESQVTPHEPKEINPFLSSEVHCCRASDELSIKLCHLIQIHYSLSSTTVTGIPMKEEQNATSSANYDVEIFHLAAAHSGQSPIDLSSIRTRKEGCEYETITLRWCTPRSCVNEPNNCSAMYRITPVDVNSRPSSCLINFLLNGRSVLLEMPRKSGGKLVSHVLSAHGGEIFIHTLVTARTLLEDPPSISEGSGGRVTDYRITDFGALMKQNRLVPIKMQNITNNNTESPLERMRARLDRQTKFWPITLTSTFIFNIPNHIEPLSRLITQSTLTDEEVVQCKQVIYQLIGMENKNEPLITPNTGQRGKGPKREEQYRIMWSELEDLVRAHSRTDSHNQVLRCLLECRNKSDESSDTKRLSLADDKVELDQALRELDQLTGPDSSNNEPGSSHVQRASVIRATTDSPMSPPPMSSSSSGVLGASSSSNGSSLKMKTSIYSRPKTLLDIMNASKNSESSMKENRREFHGQQNAEKLQGGGCIAKLYPNISEPDRHGTVHVE